jgi:hypothetical protein
MNNDFLDLRDYYDPYVGFKTSHERFDEILDDMGLTRETEGLEDAFYDELSEWAFTKSELVFGDLRAPNAWLRYFDNQNLLILYNSGAVASYEENHSLSFATDTPTVLYMVQDAYAEFFVMYARENLNGRV